ncbi:MAG: hypothetical protein DRG71_05740 [Deltaproteobacteria bacterium]|uniref:Serine/threonine-protein phosphatase n=1 Tax=Thermococcus litoralis TaxID=2265 RepID=A0A7C0Y125_THELI|nr:MAG: hypothetical protein DRG71_05740 [Deltaproteobacteria bacterium]HDD31570.1 serine/threonine-protein phosphatase [Thermococcus litoralis]
MSENLEECGNYVFGSFVKHCQLVGGDHVIIKKLGHRKTILLLADVSGHGVPSALVTGKLHRWADHQARKGLSVVQFANALNQYLYLNTAPEIYVTMFIGIIDIDSNLLEYVLAGHPEPIICEVDAEAKFSEEADIAALGLFPEINAKSKSILFHPGTTLYAYSDGLSEHLLNYGNEDDLKRVIEGYDKRRKMSLSWIYEKVVELGQGRVPDDDVSILMISRRA